MEKNVSDNDVAAEFTRDKQLLNEALKLAVKAEFEAAKAAEERARKNGTEQEWNRAYGAFLALQRMLDSVEAGHKDYFVLVSKSYQQKPKCEAGKE
ncbi:hypothetical protein [Phaeodactylibacter sp.]|uniref:hypothetical protein n=1 Tax=Phaeodactylibacter sp. TaxID=1940289 RepID=UPI0025E63396|nr:hypothetical protein [Phaeodactylibacter sp.]MCI5093485.1 hypothetical protein [Phaeodactylibacter sp.]